MADILTDAPAIITPGYTKDRWPTVPLTQIQTPTVQDTVPAPVTPPPAPAVNPVTPAPQAVATPTTKPATGTTYLGRDITNNETVQGQLNNIIRADSPLMQSAAGTANAASNARGLLNSSLGVGAAQKAVIDTATPIATADANIFANSGQSAQEAAQQLKLTNAQGLIQQQIAAQQAQAQQALAAQQAQAQRSLAEYQAEQGLIAAAQNIAGNKDIATMNNAANMDLQTTLKQMGINYDLITMQAKQGEAYGNASNSIIQQSMGEIGTILRQPDSSMDQATKTRAVNDIKLALQENLTNLGAFYNYDVSWPQTMKATETPVKTVSTPPPPDVAGANSLAVGDSGGGDGGGGDSGGGDGGQ